MSYSSRVYRHRNAHSNDKENDNEQSAFFNKADKKSAAGKGGKPFFQAKMNVSGPDDKLEKEADNVAGAVTNKKGAQPVVKEDEATPVQRLATSGAEEKISTDEERMKRDKQIQTKGECEECKRKKELGGVQKKDMPGPENDAEKEKEELDKGAVAQKKAQGGSKGNAKSTSAGLSSRIKDSTGKGNSMSGKTLSDMQNSFGADFSNVNIHTDAESADMNKQLHAQAFTYGKDVFFNTGKYNPESAEGKFLLAHELTHVIQQNGKEGDAANDSEKKK